MSESDRAERASEDAVEHIISITAEDNDQDNMHGGPDEDAVEAAAREIALACQNHSAAYVKIEALAIMRRHELRGPEARCERCGPLYFDPPAECPFCGYALVARTPEESHEH